MNTHPPGALKRSDEITTTRVWLVSRHRGLEAHEEAHLHRLRGTLRVGWNIDESSNAYTRDFAFTNFWFAYVYAVRLKKECGGWISGECSLV